MLVKCWCENVGEVGLRSTSPTLSVACCWRVGACWRLIYTHQHWSNIRPTLSVATMLAKCWWKIRQCKQGLSEKAATKMGEELVGRHFGRNVSNNDSDKGSVFKPDGYYRLLEDDQTNALNAGTVSQCQPQKAAELGEDLRRLILKIYSDNLTDGGRSVNYKAIAESELFERYVQMTKELQRLDVVNATLEEKLSFFINVYNALVIHATVKLGPPLNMWQRYKFFNTVSYIIGGLSYSLQDIENGVLRGNRKGVGMFMRPFGKSDPRLKVALETPEPLIHFALNCGAKSCPPIKTFSAKGIKAELKVAAEAFLESSDGVNVDEKAMEIGVSQIFKWYKEDFGGNNEALINWIKNHMGSGEKKEALIRLVNGGAYRVVFLPYDWGTNSKHKEDEDED